MNSYTVTELTLEESIDALVKCVPYKGGWNKGEWLREQVSHLPTVDQRFDAREYLANEYGYL
jgi:hypothetical protein